MIDMKLIARRHYLDQLTAVMGTPDIKVITGVRRSGKSKLMELFAGYIRENVPDANIIQINFNLPGSEYLKEYHMLNDYVEMKYAENKRNFILIDEVRLCRGFEKAIIGFHESEKYDIYITGSNAFLLSSDPATLFTGRTFRIDVYPFSFAEFVQYYSEAPDGSGSSEKPSSEDGMKKGDTIFGDRQASLEQYMIRGGMSGSYLYPTEELRLKYLRDVFETLVIRDIADRYKIRKKDILYRLSDYMIDNISNITSARNITEILMKDKNSPDSLSNKTVTTYISYLTDAFAFYKVRKYDIKGKKYLTQAGKYYLCDHAFRTALLGRRSADTGRILENIVAVELLRRGYEVYAGSLYDKEIDFVAVRRDEKIYIRVSEFIDNPETFGRECGSLLKIKDAYPKMILARTKKETYQYEGIQICDVAGWLLNDP